MMFLDIQCLCADHEMETVLGDICEQFYGADSGVSMLPARQAEIDSAACRQVIAVCNIPCADDSAFLPVLNGLRKLARKMYPLKDEVLMSLFD